MVLSNVGGHANITHVDRGALHFFSTLNYDSFLDVGCGPGGQVQAALDYGFTAIGLDGDVEFLGEPNVLLCDITARPIEFPDFFDVVWSVEVAEHIPPEHEDVYLQTCVRNCGKVFVLTASQNPKPKWHVNIKPLSYWKSKVESMGLRYDEHLYRQVLEHSTMEREFLRENGMVFRA